MMKTLLIKKKTEDRSVIHGSIICIRMSRGCCSCYKSFGVSVSESFREMFIFITAKRDVRVTTEFI